MDMYTAVKNRILQLLGEKKMSIHKLAMESAVAPSSIKNILYGKSINPGVTKIKMLCDGFGITIVEFFDTEVFNNSKAISRMINETIRPDMYSMRPCPKG